MWADINSQHEGLQVNFIQIQGHGFSYHQDQYLVVPVILPKVEEEVKVP